MGTTAYMSLEQSKGAIVDHRSDIWSLGVVLYELLTGETPFKGEYEQAVIYSILNEDHDPVSTRRTDVPAALEQIINKMLDKDKEKRYQTAGLLLEDMRKLKADSAPELSVSKTKTNMEIKINNSKKKHIYSGIAILLLSILLMFLIFFPENVHKKSISSIGVLPFSNLKMDSEIDYLGFALADQIIGDLIYLKNITVRPSSSVRKYEKKLIEPILAGNDLKVDYVLTGNFLKEKKDIKLSIELIEVETNKMIWRERIEVKYKNTFKLQAIVSNKVIKGLRIQFSQGERKRMESNIPGNSLAYEYYLRSISYPHTNKGDRLAIEMLKKSIELDSNYAPAYDQLGSRMSSLAQFGLLGPVETKKAEEYLLKAISINGSLLSALGNLSNLYTESARIEEAVALTKKMIKINPNNALAYYSLGYIYRFAGMNIESIKNMEKAITIDPKNSRFRSWGLTYMIIGEYEKAIKAFNSYKNCIYCLGWKGIARFRQGNKNQALINFDQVIKLEPDGLWAQVSHFFKAIIHGNTSKGSAAMLKLEQANLKDSEAWYYWASHYALIGDSDGCIRSLKRAVDGGYFNYPFMKTDFFLDSVRDDPEFKKILEKAKEKHLAFKKIFFK